MNLNSTIPSNIWSQVGVYFDEKIQMNQYRRLQTIYQQYDDDDDEFETIENDFSYFQLSKIANS